MSSGGFSFSSLNTLTTFEYYFLRYKKLYHARGKTGVTCLVNNYTCTSKTDD
jgi:hypothetical protein